MSDTVSIVITCHNLERYIEQCILSVLSQKFEGPLEVVVVDDCSDDRSAELICQFPSVRYLRTQRNVGVLLATVAGIEGTSGDVVLFMDGDDVWEPNKVRSVLHAFASDPRVALVTHDLCFIDAGGHETPQASRSAKVFGSMSPDLVPEAVRQGILTHGDYVWLGSAYAVHRTRAQLERFCAFARGLSDAENTYQDWPLAYWVASLPVSMAYLPERLFRYRVHGANHSGDSSEAHRALRNVRRARNTMRAIQRIGDTLGASQASAQATSDKLRFYEYLVCLYEGRRLHATSGFIRSLPYVLSGAVSWKKEVARFLAIQALGLQVFVAVKVRVS